MMDAGTTARDGAPVLKCEALTLAVPGRVLERFYRCALREIASDGSVFFAPV